MSNQPAMETDEYRGISKVNYVQPTSNGNGRIPRNQQSKLCPTNQQWKRTNTEESANYIMSNQPGTYQLLYNIYWYDYHIVNKSTYAVIPAQ